MYRTWLSQDPIFGTRRTMEVLERGSGALSLTPLLKGSRPEAAILNPFVLGTASVHRART